MIGFLERFISIFMVNFFIKKKNYGSESCYIYWIVISGRIDVLRIPNFPKLFYNIWNLNIKDGRKSSFHIDFIIIAIGQFHRHSQHNQNKIYWENFSTVNKSGKGHFLFHSTTDRFMFRTYGSRWFISSIWWKNVLWDRCVCFFLSSLKFSYVCVYFMILK